MTPERDGAPPQPLDAEPPADPSPARADAPAPSRWARHAQLGLAALGCVAIIGVNVYFSENPQVPPAAAGASAAVASAAPQGSAQGEGSAAVRLAAPASSTEPALELDAGPAPEAEEPAPSDEPQHKDEPAPRDKKGPKNVEWAARRACSTAPVEGLSRQIIAESRCLDASAFARVPTRKNFESAGHLFLYLDAPARDHLLRVLDAHPNRVMKVHSALRTVAQQYLLSRWANEKRCGIQLATKPGESNHETGLALDVSDPGTWRPALENEGFRWLGTIDRVHFDYVGAGATHHQGLDVRAFQRLWNRNHPDDAIPEDGHYDVATEVRLKRAPADGFPIGARCGGGGGSARAHAR